MPLVISSLQSTDRVIVMNCTKLQAQRPLRKESFLSITLYQYLE